MNPQPYVDVHTNRRTRRLQPRTAARRGPEVRAPPEQAAD